ncbi:MAG: transcriptional repressor LexA [Lacunisphaera sp.]|nr:transcriptional repressor LexA [Lacunisphaera sp.]
MLTEKQEAILDFIRQYQRREKVPPSSRIIQSQFNLKAQSGVRQHLAALATKGLLEQYADGRWGVKGPVQTHLFEVPILGSIPAGLPTIEEQASEEMLSIDPALFGIERSKPSHFFALRVAGDSMIDAHILPGDLILCEWREPRVGDIIAALVDETTTTLKQVVRDRGRIILRAANSSYPDIHPDRLETQGVVRGLVRAHLSRSLKF